MKISRPTYKVKVIGQRSRSPRSPRSKMFPYGMHCWEYDSVKGSDGDMSSLQFLSQQRHQEKSSEPDSTESLSILDFWDGSGPDIYFSLCWLEIIVHLIDTIFEW